MKKGDSMREIKASKITEVVKKLQEAKLNLLAVYTFSSLIKDNFS